MKFFYYELIVITLIACLIVMGLAKQAYGQERRQCWYFTGLQDGRVCETRKCFRGKEPRAFRLRYCGVPKVCARIGRTKFYLCEDRYGS